MSKAVVRIDENGNQNLQRSMVRFGKIARDDPDTEIHIYEVTAWEPDVEAERLVREFVNGAKSKKYHLDPGKAYIVVVIGDKIAGVASTAPKKLVAPFNVLMNPPEDHSKDFMKISVPANEPIEGDLKRSILAALKDK